MFEFPFSDGRHSAHRRGEAKTLLLTQRAGLVSVVLGWLAISAKEVCQCTQKSPYGGAIHGRNRFRDLLTKFPGFGGLLDVNNPRRKPVNQVLGFTALEFR